MSDDPKPDEGSDNEPNIKALRDAAEQGKVDRAENDRLSRELAFAKAGIDTESKLGNMLAKTYEGDLTDVDALKAEWAELNPVAAGDPTKPPETAPTPEGFQDPSGQQQHRDSAVTGDPTGEAKPDTKHPVDLAFERFHSNPQMPIDDRREGALTTIFGAYFEGDKRVMFDREAHRQAAMNASMGDGAQ